MVFIHPKDSKKKEYGQKNTQKIGPNSGLSFLKSPALAVGRNVTISNIHNLLVTGVNPVPYSRNNCYLKYK